jgi:hypothetical protein
MARRKGIGGAASRLIPQFRRVDQIMLDNQADELA